MRRLGAIYSVPSQKGGTLLGLALGILVGVLLSFAVVWYLNRAPLPFVEKTTTAPAPGKPGEGPAPLPGKPGDKPLSGTEKRFEFYDILEGKKPSGSGGETAPAAPAATPPVTAAPEAGAHLYLQVGAFQKAQEAENLKARLALAGFEASIVAAEIAGKGTVHRVRVGPFASLEEMNRTRKELSDQGIAASPVKQD